MSPKKKSIPPTQIFKKATKKSSAQKTKATKIVKLKDVKNIGELDTSGYFVKESYVMEDMIEKIKVDLKTEIDAFNKTKKNLKDTYTNIQQLRGALDVLTFLTENYDLVQK